MANVALALKEQIARISKRESRTLLEPLRQQLGVLRKTVSDLKQSNDVLRRQMATLSKGTVRSTEPRLRDAAGKGPAPSVEERKFRYSASGLRKLRERLELSRANFAILVGASEQTVSNWENQKMRPRQGFLEKIAIVRGLSKRAAHDLLERTAEEAT